MAEDLTRPVEPDYQEYHEAAQKGEFKELEGVEQLEKAYEKINEFIEEETEFIEEVRKAVSKPIALHHHDFMTVMKEASGHIGKIHKLVEELKEDTIKDLQPEKAAELYDETFENLAELDEDIRKCLMTNVLLMRVFAGYYRIRLVLDKYLTFIGQKLEQVSDENAKEKLGHIIKEYSDSVGKIQELIKVLVFLTRRHVPTGPLYKIVEDITDLCEAEGIHIERRMISKHGMGTEFKDAGKGKE